MFLQDEEKPKKSRWGFGSDNSTEKQTQDMVSLANQIDLAKLGLKSLGKQIKDSMAPDTVLKTKLALEELTTTMVRETMGQTKVVAEGIEKTIANATFETSLFGITADDNLRLISEMSSEMQMVTLLTGEQVTNMQLLGRSMGVASKDMATLVRGFSDIGVGTDQAIENIHVMSKQARAYGINVSQFMGKISENIKRISTYNFRDGIEGFTRMIAKAQALRIDVGSTFKLAEGLMDPAKAIEMAAGFQMVGGAVGALGDPFKLLHMAQNDVAGLQDELLKASESAVSFNEETGEFDIAVTEMYRLREMAQMTGKSYEEIADEAMKAKQRTEKLRILENSVGSFSDEQKELISNFGQIVKDGRGGVDLKVQIPGMQELVDAEDLTPEQIAKLEDLQKENAKSELDVSKEIRDINKEQLSVLKAREGLDYQIQSVSALMSTETPAIGDITEVFKSATVAGSEGLREGMGEGRLSNVGQALSKAIEEGFQSPEANMALSNNIRTLTQELQKQFSDIPLDVKNSLQQTDNIFKGKDNPLALVGRVLGDFVGDVIGLDINSFKSSLSGINTGIEQYIRGKDIHLEQRTEQRTDQRDQSYMGETDGTTPSMDTLTTNRPDTMDSTATANIEESYEVNKNIENNRVVNNNTEQTPKEINVSGSIDLRLNGTDFEKIDVVQLMKNPAFKARVEEIASGKGTLYG